MECWILKTIIGCFFAFYFLSIFIYLFQFLDFWPFCNATMRLLYFEKRSLKYRVCGSLQTCYSLCSTDNHPSKVHPYPPSGDSLSSFMDRALRTRVVKRIVGHQGKRKRGPPPPILQIMTLKLSQPRCVISKESVQQK